MAGELKHQDPLTIPDDPAVTAAGGITGTKWNKALRLSGGTDKQILVRSTAADGTTGMDLTDRPSAAVVVFPLSAPSSPANGSFWIEDDGVTVSLKVKRSNGDIVTIEF